MNVSNMNYLNYFCKILELNKLVSPLLIVLMSFLSLPLSSQRIWQRLDNMHYFQPEDIELSNSGKIYVAVSGRNMILESLDQGNSWRNIVIDTVKYNTFNTQKELYIDHRDSLIEFLHNFGFLFPSYYDGTNFYLDTLLFQNLNAWKGIVGKVKYDLSNKYYFIDKSNELKQYSIRWFESKKIFDNGNKIRNYYVYTDSINYIITDFNSSHAIYKFNSLTSKSRLLTTMSPSTLSDNILITANGKILTPTHRGLFLSKNEGLNFKLVTFDSLIDPITFIYDLRFTLQGNILMRADADYYYSIDEGDHWYKLGAFNNDFPEYLQIKKLEALDSQLAVMIINDKCDLERAYLLSPITKAWKPIDAGISVLDMGHVYKDKLERLYAKDQLCEMVYSDDESKSWETYYIDGKNLGDIIPTKAGSLIAVTKNEKQLYRSLDNGNNWTLISDIDLGIPTIEITGINPLFDQTVLIVGGIRDPGTVTYKEYFYLITHDNGKSWKLLPKETYQYIQTIVWNGRGKLYSYAFKKKEVYSSIDFGQSWNVDHTFDGFEEIYTMSFNNNGGVVIQGIFHGVKNVYVSFDGVNFFAAVGDYFKQEFVGFREVSYPYIAAIAGIKGVYLSNDGGLNWEDITSGITILDSVLTVINSVYVDEKNYAYLSIQYDGLYKSINPLVSILDEGNSSSNFIVYPNPFLQDLVIKCSSCLDDKNVIEIYDPLGKLIRKEVVDMVYKQLHFNQNLPPGLYAYKLLKSGSLYDSGKIINLNH